MDLSLALIRYQFHRKEDIMLTLKLRLEYKCYPTWIYNEQCELIDNYLPEEIKNSGKIKELLSNIQEDYDSLYIDNGIEFKYKGFREVDIKRTLEENVDQAYEILQKELNGSYVIVNTISFENL